MKRLPRSGKLPLLLVVIATTTLACAATAAAGTTSSGNIVYQANPPVQQVTGASPMTFTNPFCSQNRFICYTPSDVRTAYGFPSNLDGTGQTIVIVDAFGSPTIKQDLATFDARFGLPAPPSFRIVCPDGCPTFNPRANGGNQIGWAFETSLDVEWAHAMAPGADIVLAVTPTNFGNAINSVETKIIEQFPGSIMSQSFGAPEAAIAGRGNNLQLMQAHRNYQAAQHAGISVLASAGDSGATNGGSIANGLFPASDPLVTAIGGTEGDPYFNAPAGAPLPTCALNTPCTVGLSVVQCTSAMPLVCPTIGYGGEQVWNEPFFGASTGGAPSLVFGAPAYQQGVNGSTQRTTPDVSYDAAVSGGVLVAVSFPGIPSGFFIVGGTSAGSPQWASIIALANQSRGLMAKPSLGFLNDTIYSIAKTALSTNFHDITVGNNQNVGTPVGFSAAAGYDIASGWGTPKVTHLVSALANS